MKPKMEDEKLFDGYALNYDTDLARGIRLSGENKEYFAEQRIIRLTQYMESIEILPRRILDFGCGIGTAAPFLRKFHPDAFLSGVDISADSIALAKRFNTDDQSSFFTLDSYTPQGDMDLVYCNGVFHHIPPGERPGALQCVRDSLGTKGIFSFWENNPWNPGTRLVMSRIPFDRDAVTISAHAAVKMLKENGFAILSVSHWFVFPSVLSWLRFTESFLSNLPVGAQYQVLCRKI